MPDHKTRHAPFSCGTDTDLPCHPTLQCSGLPVQLPAPQRARGEPSRCRGDVRAGRGAERDAAGMLWRRRRGGSDLHAQAAAGWWVRVVFACARKTRLVDSRCAHPAAPHAMNVFCSAGGLLWTVRCIGASRVGLWMLCVASHFGCASARLSDSVQCDLCASRQQAVAGM